MAKTLISMRYLNFLSYAKFYLQIIKNFNKIVISINLILKNILSTLVFINIGVLSDIVNLDNNKIISINEIGNIVIDKKMKNLSKAKNFIKLAKSKKPEKTQINDVFKTGIIIFKAKVRFI